MQVYKIIKQVIFQNVKLVEHPKITYINVAHQQNRKQKICGHLIRHKTEFDRNPRPIHDKNM